MDDFARQLILFCFTSLGYILHPFVRHGVKVRQSIYLHGLISLSYNLSPRPSQTPAMVTVQQNASVTRTLEEKAEQLLAKARLPMQQKEAQEVAELLEKVSTGYFHPLIDIKLKK
jgi:hypothetical protein